MKIQQGRTRGGVAYTVRGSGPPLLWMSGYAVPVAAFDRVLDDFARTFTVVAVDHRGSGESWTRPLPTTTGTMACDAVSVLDRLGIASAQVVGASLGGMVAQEIAIAHPNRVRSLVLCSTTAGGSGAKTPPLRDLQKELNQTARRVPGPRFRIRWLGALHQAAAAASHDATGRLRKIQAPTLVLHGDQDELVPLANATWLAARIPDGRLRVVPNGTHLLVLESAAARNVLHLWLEEHAELTPDVARPSGLLRLAGAPIRVLRGHTLPVRRAVRAARRHLDRGSSS